MEIMSFENQVMDLVKTEMLKHGFNVGFKTFKVTGDGVKFETETFQTQPIIFKDIRLKSSQSSYIEGEGKVFVVSVMADYSLFNSGFNTTELYRQYIGVRDNRAFSMYTI